MTVAKKKSSADKIPPAKLKRAKLNFFFSRKLNQNHKPMLKKIPPKFGDIVKTQAIEIKTSKIRLKIEFIHLSFIDARSIKKLMLK